jgi:hypothetical protein
MPEVPPNFNALMHKLALLLLLLFVGPAMRAQTTITGVVAELVNGQPLSNVIIQNVHTNASLITEADGKFSIKVAPGQLIEFRKIGYKTARLRISSNVTAPYYRILLETGVQELEEIQVRNRHRTFKQDSIEYYTLFKKELEFPKLTGINAIYHPFSALSKKNQMIWHFQEEYEWFEHQKFVDYNFNERLVAQLTGLQGDSALQYMRRYRPSYEMVRSMPEYDFFSYVKQTVEAWRRTQKFGNSNSRSSGGGG